mgnify:CR=1 FL=1
MISNRKKYIQTLLFQNKNILCQIGVKSIGIFGSVARGDDNENSDYDILVEFNKDCRKFYNFNKLCEFLEKNIGNKFDLVTKDGLSPYIGGKILEEVEYVAICN